MDFVLSLAEDHLLEFVSDEWERVIVREGNAPKSRQRP